MSTTKQRAGKSAEVAPASSATSAPAVDTKSSAASPSADAQWKPAVKKADVIIGMVMSTIFFLLATFDYSICRGFVLQLTPGKGADNQFALDSIASYLTWRYGGCLPIKYFELFVTCTLPLVIYKLVVDNIRTFKGVRASPLRNLLDAENLIQIFCIATLVATRIQPTSRKIVETLEKQASLTSGLQADLDALIFYQLLAMLINAGQWLVPLARWNGQKKQEQMQKAEAGGKKVE